MRRLSRRRLLAGFGTAWAVGTAGCTSDGSSDAGEPTPGSDDTPGQAATQATETPTEKEGQTTETPGEGNEPTDTDDEALPPALEEGLSFLTPEPDASSILRLGEPGVRGNDIVAAPTDLGVTEDSEIDRILRQGRKPGEPAKPDPSGGYVLVGSTAVAESSRMERTGTTGAFDRYDAGGPRQVATDGEILLAGRPSWVEDVLERNQTDAETYFEANPRVRRLLEQFGPTGYNLKIIEGAAVAEQRTTRWQFEFSTVPDALAWGSREHSGQLNIGLGALYGTPVGEPEREEFRRLASTEFDLTDPDVETRGDGRVLVVEQQR